MRSAALKNASFETGVYRPPSEGGSYSLLIRVTRNCPWNRCEFCSMYKTEKFEVRTPEEVKHDIDSIAAICDQFTQISNELGYNGRINRDTVITFLQREPEIADPHGVSMIANWLQSGAKTAFLQDANSPILKTDQLVEILEHLRRTFPSLNRATSYARSKTIAQKSLEELKAIRKAGLDRLHVGLESGDDELLKKIKKGVTAEVHIKGGKKAMQAGFQLSEYWMPGLGGKEFSEAHARNTARVLNAIDPNYIRSRPFNPLPGTSLFEDSQNGKFQLLTPNEQLTELKLMMEELDFSAKVCFDHAANYWRNRNGGLLFTHSYEGYQFPEEKGLVLDLIDEGLKADNKFPRFLRL